MGHCQPIPAPCLGNTCRVPQPIQVDGQGQAAEVAVPEQIVQLICVERPVDHLSLVGDAGRSSDYVPGYLVNGDRPSLRVGDLLAEPLEPAGRDNEPRELLVRSARFARLPCHQAHHVGEHAIHFLAGVTERTMPEVVEKGGHTQARHVRFPNTLAFPILAECLAQPFGLQNDPEGVLQTGVSC